MRHRLPHYQRHRVLVRELAHRSEIGRTSESAVQRIIGSYDNPLLSGVHVPALRVVPGDKRRAALPADVNLQPVERDEDMIASANLKIDIGERPQPWGQRVLQVDPARICDHDMLPNGRQRSGIFVSKWPHRIFITQAARVTEAT